MFSRTLLARVSGFLKAYMTSAPSPPPELIWFDINITSDEFPNLFRIVFTLSVGDNVVSESLVMATGTPNSLNLSYIYFDIWRL